MHKKTQQARALHSANVRTVSVKKLAVYNSKKLYCFSQKLQGQINQIQNCQLKKTSSLFQIA